MPSHVNLLIPLAVLLVPLVLGRRLAKRGSMSKSGWATGAALVCLAVGVAIAIGGGPSRLIAGEDAPQQATQQEDGARRDAAAAEPGDAAQPGAEQGAGEPKGEPAKGVQIESWLWRSLFNLLLLAVFLVVLVGPFYLGNRLTREWRQPLWGWPIGLVFFCAAVVAAVFLLRWLVAPLPAAFGGTLERYLKQLADLWKLWTFVALVAVPVWLGNYLSRKWRMPDYAVRIGVVSFCILAGLVVTILGWPPKLGIDLSGGVILVYDLEGEPGGGPQDEFDQEPGGKGEGEKANKKQAAQPLDARMMDKLIQAIRLRVDPSNVRELTIRKYGERQIEVIIPEADEEELARIKRKISSAGTLEFRILANRRDHASLIEDARKIEGRDLRDSTGKLRAWWVPVKQGQEEHFLRFSESAETVYRKRTYRGYEWTEYLVVNDLFNVTGGYLVRSTTGVDESGWKVLFTFNRQGGNLFNALTANNLPNKTDGFRRHLGIILDGYLQSAPGIKTAISQRGEISGGFTREAAEDLVDILNAGSLPTALSEEPISEDFRGPGLGQDTIDRGKIAIGVSMALVVVFMLVYYLFAGLVACLALSMNLILILAIMISIRAAFTLPGLAGLVLTVGMAVDANVLIFERIREELSRQSTLRMAIRNGFGRATTTIVDANLTTLITAIVLYVVGTDQIKGFAVTLFLGVLLSMFTAVYCSRLVFDVAEKQKWITRLKMMQMLGKTQIDFLGMRWPALAGSMALIVIGLLGVAGRGAGLLDIDFTGGVRIRARFNTQQDIADIRAKLGDEGEGLQDLAVSGVRSLNETESGREFIIDTSGYPGMRPDIESDEILAEVKRRINKAFGPDLVHYSVEVTMLPAAANGPQSNEQPAQPAPQTQTRTDLPPDSLLASADPSAIPIAQPKSGEEETASSDEQAKASAGPAQRTYAKLQFEHRITHESLKRRFDKEIERQHQSGVLSTGTIDFTLSNQKYLTEDSEAPYSEWDVQIGLPPDEGQALLLAVEKELESEPFFPSSNTIGGQVALGMRVKAVWALLMSLVCIVGYIWIRFQRVMFGLAAVIALIHDVLITLGLIALTAYVAPFLGFLLIGEFKIGLPVLAAFLTIIGYSLNDTIVVFDRIREVRGKAPRLTGEMVNNSINQTLSRTVLTSLTTLIVVVVLYIGGGESIHVFAFALVVGVLVGTYSSIFVASPALFWMATASGPVKKGRPSPRGA